MDITTDHGYGYFITQTDKGFVVTFNDEEVGVYDTNVEAIVSLPVKCDEYLTF